MKHTIELEDKDIIILKSIFRKIETEYRRDLIQNRETIVDAVEFNELLRMKEELK